MFKFALEARRKSDHIEFVLDLRADRSVKKTVLNSNCLQKTGAIFESDQSALVSNIILSKKKKEDLINL